MDLYGNSRLEDSGREAHSFLKNLVKKAPFLIPKILTDNGKEFTDLFCLVGELCRTPTGEREPTGKHVFDQECAEHGIQHRLIKLKKPQTNGMVERFNGRIEEIFQQTRFESASRLEETLIMYLRIYYFNIPQKKSRSCHADRGFGQMEEYSSCFV
jgi:hypothetical protein